MKMIRWAIVGLLLVWVPVAGAALAIGDQAPSLRVTSWVKGERVDPASLRGRGVMVIEFWATWCAPCRATIPHLTELQGRYASQGLVVVGITRDDPDNGLDKVKAFVTRQGDKMGYVVGFDAKGQTYDSYMRAANQEGIPTAFLVDRSGKVAWIGHPMSLDAVLPQVMAGTYDVDAAKRVSELRQRVSGVRGKATTQSGGRGSRRGGGVTKARQELDPAEIESIVAAADEILAANPSSPGAWEVKLLAYAADDEQRSKALEVGDEAVEQLAEDRMALTALAQALLSRKLGPSFDQIALHATKRALKLAPNDLDVSMAYFEALDTTKNQRKAIRLAAKLIRSAQGNPQALHGLAERLSGSEHGERYADLARRAIEGAIKAEPDEVSHRQTKFDILLQGRKDPREIRAAGREVLEVGVDDAVALNDFARAILFDDDSKERYKELALEAAERCHEVSGGTNWQYLDTLTLARAANGQTADALTVLRQAIQLCQDRALKEQLEKKLKELEGGD